MSEPVRFRAATLEDVPAVVALVQSAYRGDSSRVGWTTEADLLDGIRIDAAGVSDALQHVDSFILLCESARELLACAHVERQGQHAYFGMFAVQPPEQGNGVGRRVLAEAERQVVERWGVTRMVMKVIDARGDLMAWYERRGYRRTGEHEPFPYGDPRFGVPRRHDLRFERMEKTLAGERAA